MIQMLVTLPGKTEDQLLAVWVQHGAVAETDELLAQYYLPSVNGRLEHMKCLQFHFAHYTTSLKGFEQQRSNNEAK